MPVKIANAEERLRANPYTFEIPPRELRASLEVGDFAKVIFVSDPPIEGVGGPSGERMWLKITDVNNGRYRGSLNNDPAVFLELKCGQLFDFGPENVINIDKP